MTCLMKSAVVCGVGSGTPFTSAPIPMVAEVTSNVANRVNIWMPVTIDCETPVPSRFTRNTTGHRPLPSVGRPTPLKPVQHWFELQPDGRAPMSHAAGGTRAPVEVARSSMYASEMHPAVGEVDCAERPTRRAQMFESAVLVSAREGATPATLSGDD